MDRAWSAFEAGDGSGPVVGLCACLVLACLLAGAGTLVAFRRLLATHARLRTPLCAVLAWLLIGSVAACVASAAASIARWRAADGIKGIPVSSFSLITVGDPQPGEFGNRIDARVLDRSGALVATVELESERLVEGGERLACVGRFEELEGDWGRSKFMTGIVATVRTMGELRGAGQCLGPIESVRAAALESIDAGSGQDRALLAGIVCGRTTELGDAEASDAFRMTGTTHLIAVSGSHLTLVSSLVLFATKRARVPLRARTVIVAVLMGAYVVFTGASASAVRSLIMVCCALASSAAGRRGHSLSGLSAAVLAILIVNPGTIYDLGFQLSAMSVLFIILFHRYLSRMIVRLQVPDAIAEPLALTLSAQWATLPITVSVFGEVSLVAPLANLALGAIMSGLLAVGVITVPTALAVPFAGVLLPADILARASIFIAEALASVPFAAMAVDSGVASAPIAAVLYGAAAIAYALWRIPPPRAAAAVMSGIVAITALHVARWGLFAPPSITVLDVGQGDAILVRDGSQAVLLDCGLDDSVARALWRNNVVGLDAVVVTHWDLDHWGGLKHVVATAGVPQVIVPLGAETGIPEEYGDAGAPAPRGMACGQSFSIGGFTCEMVWPEDPVASSENESSLVLCVTYGDAPVPFRVLLTGDSESDQAESYASEVGEVDVLKLGHHGSRESCSEEMLGALEPKVAIASAGEGNSYGHPAPEAVEAVRRSGALFLCTIESGDISIEPSSTGIAVTVQRGSVSQSG